MSTAPTIILNDPAPIQTPMFQNGLVNPDGSLNIGALTQAWSLWFANQQAAINQLLSGANVLPANTYSASENITADLYGIPDTRPGTWGVTSFVDNQIQFNPPAGMVTRILRIYGNVYYMPKVPIPGSSPVPPANSYVGLLWGFITTAPGGSTRMVPGADDCMAFYQAGMSSEPGHFEFDANIGLGATDGQPTLGLLQPDNLLISRFANFLDTQLNVPTHIEMEMVIQYTFEPIV